MKIFVGIDVSKSSMDVAFPQGQRFKHLHYPHNQAETASAILQDLPTQDVHIVMEATGNYSFQLANAFFELGIPVSLVNPLCIKYFSKMKLRRAKTDRIDARTISQYGTAERPPCWHPRVSEQEELRQVVKAIEDLHNVKTSLTNRQEAAGVLPVQSSVCQNSLQQLVDQVEHQLNRLEAEMIRLAKAFHEEAYKLLLTIKGIGEKTACALIAFCGNFETFETAAQVVAFAGLNPSPYSSGTSVKGRGGISKRGHSILRKLVYMGAGSAAQHNPACRALSKRLKEQGKNKQLVRVAVAHKLLRQAFGVVKRGKPFDPNYSQN